MRHLIVGFGSIGMRHVSNLVSMNEVVIIYDRHLHDFDERLKEVDSVFITCPTINHMEYALKAAKANKHVFIEKPISHNNKDIKNLYDICRKNNKTCYVGYNFRFHKELIDIKERLNNKDVSFVKVEVGEYLPGWHPDKDYRKEYSARKDMGGGVVLTLSHEIDYIRWIFGKIKTVKAIIGKTSDLELDVEDTASVIMETEKGVFIELHMDYIQKPAVRTMKVRGKNIDIDWDYYANKEFDRNQMFIDEVTHYINCCNGNATPVVTEEEVVDVMNIIEEIKNA